MMMMRTGFGGFSLLALFTAACGSGGGSASATATDGNGSSETGTASVTDSNSMSDSITDTTPTTEGSGTDPSSSSTDPTVADSSSGGEMCTEADACIVDGDCAPGQMCLGCLCLGDPMGCADWGEGAFGDCVGDTGTIDNTVCMAAGAKCLVDDPAAPQDGVCFFDCEMPCDCPAPPTGFETQVACDDLTGDGTNDCFIDCSGGADCPDSMYCFMGTLCFFGEAPMGLPPFSDCVNEPGMCEDGVCLSNNPMDPDWGFCGQNCATVDDCAVPETGNVDPTCVDATGSGDLLCVLACAPDATCPDGMICEPTFDVCVWEVIPPPPPPWGDCETMPVDVACAPTDTCIDTPEGGICGAPCTDATDCPDAPATGDAVVTCSDLGMGNVCSLSCAMGETCPDGTVCSGDLYCHYAAL